MAMLNNQMVYPHKSFELSPGTLYIYIFHDNLTKAQHKRA